MNQQLTLAIQLNDEANFSNFFWEENTLLKKTLFNTLGERMIYLWGVTGSGKSHLLQACCQATLYPHTAGYYPLDTLKDYGPDALEGTESLSLLCLDSVDAIAGDSQWEEALFHLYNRIRDGGETRLILSGSLPPSQLPIKLPDLRSRLGWGLVIQLHELNDEDKIKTLILQAKKRGFHLPESVGRFLLNRCSRNMHDLHQILDKLDKASLRSQRRITLPFAKQTLNL